MPFWSRKRAAAEWEPFHRYRDGRRWVSVKRGDELEPVGNLAADDPDYEDKFLKLMDSARERAAILNSES